METTHKSTDGYIYILYNDAFQHYGVDVFKIGRTKDVVNRLSGYTTSYIHPCEFKYVSKICKNASQAELIIFNLLSDCRMVKDREFFKLTVDKATKIIEQVVDQINGDEYDKDDHQHQNKIETYNEKYKMCTQIITYPINLNKDKIINDLIIKLGIHDGNRVNRTDILNNIYNLKGCNIFSYDKPYCKAFNTSPLILNNMFNADTSLKRLLGYINRVLSKFSLKVMSYRSREYRIKNLVNYYYIGSK